MVEKPNKTKDTYQMTTTIYPLWDDEGHPVEAIHDKFESGATLEGTEALALLGAMFSNATKNNHSAKQLVDRVAGGFKVTITKA